MHPIDIAVLMLVGFVGTALWATVNPWVGTAFVAAYVSFEVVAYVRKGV